MVGARSQASVLVTLDANINLALVDVRVDYCNVGLVSRRLNQTPGLLGLTKVDTVYNYT